MGNETLRKSAAFKALKRGDSFPCFVKSTQTLRANAISAPNHRATGLVLTTYRDRTSVRVENLTRGQEVNGTVTALVTGADNKTIGVYVDIGASELGWLSASDFVLNTGRQGVNEWRTIHRGYRIKGWVKSVDPSRSAFNLTHHSPGALDLFEVGQTLSATVKQIKEYGAWLGVDQAKVEVMLPNKDIEGGSGGLKNLTVGDVIEVRVTKISEEHGRLDVTNKAPGLSATPEDLHVGQAFNGKVLGTTKHGAFVNIGFQEDAWLHHSDLEGGRWELENLTSGDMIDCWVKEVTNEKGKVVLTAREPVRRLPFEDFEVGQEVKCNVRAVMDYGAFVDIGAEENAFIHVGRIKGLKRKLNRLEAGEKLKCWVSNKNKHSKRIEVTQFDPSPVM